MPPIYEGQAIRERQAIRVTGGLLSGDGAAADVARAQRRAAASAMTPARPYTAVRHSGWLRSTPRTRSM